MTLAKAAATASKAPEAPWLMAGAGVSSALLTAFDLRAKANRTRDAWRVLRTELLRFNQSTREPVHVSRLIARYDEAERLVGDVAPEDAAAAGRDAQK